MVSAFAFPQETSVTSVTSAPSVFRLFSAFLFMAVLPGLP
ncbi:hypothetical protein GPEL0_01r5024 [Geoanaerobacter pelophilus]|uniref:Flagellar biosynthetic protein FliP n=1 Tax=Geoanaerobacter pelophilus TaxID=60036 RepID=A0ABQ0MP57_9BACT|nr:hypothetical protein GPEL0_01r5024 [Geoanaerobacter pelophilus]